MADYDHQQSKDHGNETASTGCGGMFDFLKKKENDKTQQDQGVAMKEQEHHTFKNNDDSDSSSSDEEADGKVEKKKGLKDKIKEKISGNKKEEEHVTNDTPNVEGNAEEKGLIEKIRDKLPGQHKKAEESAFTEHNNGAAHGHEGEAKEKKGIMEQIKEKLPVGHKDEEKPKEN